MVFDEIIGQKVPVTIFKRGFASDSLGHAYLFSGKDGLGKETFARAIADELLKRGGPQSELHVLSGDGTIKVEEIRNLRRAASLSSGGHSIWIIVGAERMGPEASNAFLKTLEEPPEGTYFFLTTSIVHGLLPTIVSRCIHIPFRPISESEICVWLSNRTGESTDDIQIQRAARLAQGSLGKAWQYWESSLLQTREEVISKLIKIPELSYAEALGLSQTWSEDKIEVALELQFFLEWFRDLLSVKNQLELPLYNPEYEGEMEKICDYYSNKDLFSIIQKISETVNAMSWNARIRFHLGYLLLLIKKGALT